MCLLSLTEESHTVHLIHQHNQVDIPQQGIKNNELNTRMKISGDTNQFK